ncbi:HdeD family acid-resistance protein [Mesorhizobium sp. CAU 1732]|uniref:HdeD family acid-resistance protein n=1 Tax=Mesorhizobium sp. CAU 1732 TaxID=3140358 RepID=UPI003261003A
MTQVSETSESMGHAGKRSLWFVVLGVVVLGAGLFASANLLTATFASVLMVGAMMIVGGIGEIVHAFGVRTWGGFALWLLTGILYAAAGVLTFYNPMFATAILTLMIAVSLIAAGAVRIFAGLTQRGSSGWGWIVAGGVVTLVVGLVIMLRWPINSLWVLGIFLAVDLMMQGLSYITYGIGFRRGTAQG